MSGKPEVSKSEINASTQQVDSSAATATGTLKPRPLRPLRPPRTLFLHKPSDVRPKGSARGIGESSDSDNDTELPPPKIDTNTYSDSDSEAEPENFSLK